MSLLARVSRITGTSGTFMAAALAIAEAQVVMPERQYEMGLTKELAVEWGISDPPKENGLSHFEYS